MTVFLQYMVAGLTIGAIYALIALGASIIFNATRAINFAQGEFVMLGALGAAAFSEGGMQLGLAALAGLAVAVLGGALVALFVARMGRAANVEAVIIMTIGASTLIRGLAEALWGRNARQLPPFSGEAPLHLGLVTIQPQSLWVAVATAVTLAILVYFFRRTLSGKAFLAASYNRIAAQLVGISIPKIVLGSFMLAAATGAVAGIVIAPITLAYSDMGLSLGLKGFAAAMLGGLGSGPGAVVGGLTLGLAEAITAGYVSSAYKDAVGYLVIIAVLIFMPGGLLGQAAEERV